MRLAALALISTICLSTGVIAQDDAVQQRGSANSVGRKAAPQGQLVELDEIAAKLTLSKPATHANLAIYMIEGDDRLDTTDILTLADCLAWKTELARQSGDFPYY